MEGAAASANQPSQQHSNLIRTDQVQKLPHLNDQQKATHTQAVRHLWEILNTRNPQSTEYQAAQMKLTQISQTMMKGMRQYQQSRQALAQQQAAAAVNTGQGQAGQRAQTANPQTFAQLLPQIQRRVESLQFFFPPTINKDGIQQWLPEAKLRYGIALQKQEYGRARLTELRQQLAARQAAGNLTQEEIQEFKNRQLAAERNFREGSEFLNKFREQQEQFKQQQLNRGSQTGQPRPADQSTAAPPSSQTVQAAPAQSGVHGPAPSAHTINSAVNAARNQAGQTTIAPLISQPGQVSSTQAALSQETHPQLQQPQQATPAAQATFSQTPNPDGSTPTPTPVQPANPPGPPRPLSHQAAISQAAQSYSNNMSQRHPQPQVQIQVQIPVSSQHQHPQGYNPNRSSENSARNINMSITKNLNISSPEPVAMAPARPTLSGGPSHGAMGVMGQPAIQKHPGYVLEGEGQRVLSKKMLDILVRQVTGGGEGEGLTPDAEEFILQMADDFVDDVITAACRLAKLRPSSTLEIRDIQLVLERNYNMRISGFSTDDLRTVKKSQPTQGWTQKMSAVQAAKVTQGKGE